MMGGWYHDGGDWGGWLLMMLVMVAFWGLVVAAVVTLFRSAGRPDPSVRSATTTADPRAILDERLARGDIDLEDYQARRSVLRESPQAGMGRELVLELLRRDARVAAVDRNPDGLVDLTALADAGERLQTHVGNDAKVMNLAIKVVPKTAIRFVQKQMSKRLGAPQLTKES